MNGKFTKIKNKIIVSEIKDIDFRVLCYLIARSKDGKCFPSMTTIAHDLKKSKETIRNVIDRLIKINFIQKENRTLGAGKKTSNVYTINEDYLVRSKKDKLYEIEHEVVELEDYNWLEEEDE